VTGFEPLTGSEVSTGSGRLLLTGFDRIWPGLPGFFADRFDRL